MKGKIYKRKEDWCVVYLQPARMRFIPVTGQIKSHIQDGDQIEFEIAGEKAGKAKIIKRKTSEQEQNSIEEINNNNITTPVNTSVYYPRYDVYVDTITEKLTLPICSCRPQEDCIFMNNWIADGRPDRIEINKQTK